MAGSTTDHASALAASGARVLAAATAGRLDASALAESTGIRMVAAATLVPAPRDPVVHLRLAHDAARRHLQGLAAHDPEVEVVATMTTALFHFVHEADDTILFVKGYGARCSVDDAVHGVLEVDVELLDEA